MILFRDTILPLLPIQTEACIEYIFKGIEGIPQFKSSHYFSCKLSLLSTILSLFKVLKHIALYKQICMCTCGETGREGNLREFLCYLDVVLTSQLK